MNDGKIVNAKYIPTGVRRFDGNPFIEALPRLEERKDEYATNCAHYPPRPTDADRRKSEVVRIMELSVLNDVVVPFPEYQKIGLALTMLMRETYVARNPLTATDRQRRHAIATSGKDGIPFPPNWKSSGKGRLMIAVSGMGKTTFTSAFLLRYPQVVKHDSYRGEHLACHQVVHIVIRIPHDGTLKSLCLQFFKKVDELLDTAYARKARSVRQIALMIDLMREVATAISLGFLVIDEVQNLRYARGGNAAFMLNFFSEIVEHLGVSLFILGTPAVQGVIEGSVRNLRKLTSSGDTDMEPMRFTGRNGDPQWEIFTSALWDYQFTKNKGRLTDSIRRTWYHYSAGNTAFATLVYWAAQMNEIGGAERIDELAIERAANASMAFLQPAIEALRSGDRKKLFAFDDLMLSEKYRCLRRQLGASTLSGDGSVCDEFDDAPATNQIASENGPSPVRRRAHAMRKRRVQELSDTLPTEDPLAAA